MNQNIEAKIIDRGQLLQALEVSPTRAFVRPEIDVDLLMQGWFHMGLFAFQEMVIAKREESIPSVEPPAWNPRQDPIELLTGMYRPQLQQLGFETATEFLLVGYATNMKKFSTMKKGLMKERVPKNSVTLEQQEGQPKVLQGITLPPTFAEFLSGHLRSIGLNQKDYAQLIGISDASISNLVGGKRGLKLTHGGFERSAFLRVVRALGVDDETKKAIFNTYAPFHLKNRAITKDFKDPDYWVEDLYSLDKSVIRDGNFGSVEEYLATRFINSSNRLVRVIGLVDSFPSEILLNEVKETFTKSRSFPQFEELNRKHIVVPILLHAWAARGLFSLT